MTKKSQIDMIEKFVEMKKVLRWRLVGAGMFRALKVLDFVEPYNIDKEGKLMMRKDGKTPKFYHEIRQANFSFSLVGVIDREELIMTILLHDVMEDFGVEKSLILGLFGESVFNSAWAMTKKYRGMTKSPEQVFADIAADRNASLAKLLDRIDNIQSMPGVFTPAKMLLYIEEVEQYFFTMAKVARKNFPAQLDAYIGLKTMLVYQIELIEYSFAMAERYEHQLAEIRETLDRMLERQRDELAQMNAVLIETQSGTTT